MTAGRTLATPSGALTGDDPGSDDGSTAPRRRGDRDVSEVLATVDADLPAAVTDALRDFLDVRRAACAEMAEEFLDAVDDLAALALGGGKRLRPTFAWWGWRAAGGPDAPDAPHPDVVLHTVAALELIQACALVHDDLIDDSALRRGSPTVHARWTGRHRERGWIGEPERLGAAVAVLVGDVALAWADDMLRAAGLDPAALARATPVWEAMRTEMLTGQFLDVVGHATDLATPEGVLRISRYKTAAYTIERPLHLGAALAGAGGDVVSAYRRFGTDLGIAFQLRDDLLGVFGDPAVTGKPAGDDLREGKRTLLVALARNHPDQDGAAPVERALGKQDLTTSDVEAARAALDTLGVVDDVEERIATLTTSALDALAEVDLDPQGRERLVALAAAATRRTR
ncbi:polyprenyl synthetase family protein [Actinomycetospora endophytica]|uniref:Polyprenyl synthetase family protein n=1 Tax=Actinomycetospora endophytica TaxID=2291215 RepID=A0ABS8PHL6_9PSEU|nr:polyprenyl synthetase family protein [Actinomycetospora endophytica]MCD2196479.1 polyprenyl synthetase family protein [Actinomycetospora endophytica]